MPTARCEYGTSVVDGKIYIIGGTIGPPWNGLSIVEVYDPATDTWTQKTNMPTARRVFSANVLDGKVYTIGGVAGPQGSTYALATMEEYNPELDLTELNEKENNDAIPLNYYLFQNFPNPFNPSTNIKYTIPFVETHRDASVLLNVYDILGREVTNLVNEEKQPGEYEFEFNVANLPSGVYFYQLKAGSYVETKKMILLK